MRLIDTDNLLNNSNSDRLLFTIHCRFIIANLLMRDDGQQSKHQAFAGKWNWPHKNHSEFNGPTLLVFHPNNKLSFIKAINSIIVYGWLSFDRVSLPFFTFQNNRNDMNLHHSRKRKNFTFFSVEVDFVGGPYTLLFSHSLRAMEMFRIHSLPNMAYEFKKLSMPHDDVHESKRTKSFWKVLKLSKLPSRNATRGERGMERAERLNERMKLPLDLFIIVNSISASTQIVRGYFFAQPLFGCFRYATKFVKRKVQITEKDIFHPAGP